MKKFCWGICFVMMLGLAGQGKAQETPPPPYPPDDVIMVYYEDTKPDQLDILLFMSNICLERVLMLNPDLDIDDVEYGTKIYLPKDEPCYLYGSSSFDASNGRNGWNNPQRLKYYEDGQWLATPYYSADVIYTNNYYFGNTHKTPQIIADYFNVCLEDLLAQNYLLQIFDEYYSYARMSMDIFIPRHLPPCNLLGSSQSAQNTPIPDTITAIEELGSLLSPTYFSKGVYNICVEEIATQQLKDIFYNSYNRQRNTVIIEIPHDFPPCYNQYGQRLKYYDDEGNRLDDPFYSDLPIYIAQPGMTAVDVANVTNMCIEQLMKINGYPSMPLLVEIELFLPPKQPCTPEIQTVQVNVSLLEDISVITNTCQDTLIALNPYLNPRNTMERMFDRYTGWILIAKDPCYGTYTPQQGESVYDIEKILNVCFEEFYFTRQGQLINAMVSFQRVITYQFPVAILFSLDAQPCYNQLGQRLYYENQYLTGRKCNFPACYDWSNVDINPAYSSMTVYTIQKSDTPFSISKRFNVCVDVLIEKNKILADRNIILDTLSLPEKHPIFIPDALPCYSETGQSLIYYDADRNFLPIPQQSEHVMYYDAWTPLLAHYYNVCINRILDANANKYDEKGNANYLGFIIPTDRPPCYDENGVWIDYRLIDKKVHTVSYGENIISIAQQYGVPYPLIAWANGLDVNDTIWVGQKLIIPIGARTEDLIWLLGLWAGWFILAIPIYGRRWAKWCK